MYDFSVDYNAIDIYKYLMKNIIPCKIMFRLI